MVEDGWRNFNETLRKSLITGSKNQDVFLEQIFKLVLCPTKKEKAFIQKETVQTQSRIVV
jgi:hypothetical protein